MNVFEYDPTTRLIFGQNCVDRLGGLARDLGGGRVLVVTDPGIVAAGHVTRALDSLREASLQAVVFSEVEENPTTKTVEKGLRCAIDQGPIDLIVGLGGGSSMDCAKGINFLLSNGGRIEDYWGVGKAEKPMLPSIGIPTTAGTGSEGQSFALITDARTRVKMACGDRKARFVVVLLDPTLTLSMPRDVAAVTAMDAISHAVESYVSTSRTPVSQMFAREAYRLLDQNFEQALEDSLDLEARGNMLLGAHWAGSAIENSMLGAAHACANPLTARFDIIHGAAVGLMLPHVVRFNGTVAGRYYSELLKVAGRSNGDPGNSSRLLEDRLRFLRSQAGLPARLRDCKVEKEALPELAAQAERQWTKTFNPRQVDRQALLELYENAF